MAAYVRESDATEKVMLRHRPSAVLRITDEGISEDIFDGQQKTIIVAKQ